MVAFSCSFSMVPNASLCKGKSEIALCVYRSMDLIPGLEKSPGEGKGYPLQSSDLQNSMDCTEEAVPGPSVFPSGEPGVSV